MRRIWIAVAIVAVLALGAVAVAANGGGSEQQGHLRHID